MRIHLENRVCVELGLDMNNPDFEMNLSVKSVEEAHGKWGDYPIRVTNGRTRDWEFLKTIHGETVTLKGTTDIGIFEVK